VIKTTHKHRSHHYWAFNYRIVRNFAFVEGNGEWRKSSTLVEDLITVERYRELLAEMRAAAEEKARKRSKCKGGLIAKHKKSKKVVNFDSIDEAVTAGFKKFYIKACIQGDSKSHMGYVWRLAA